MSLEDYLFVRVTYDQYGVTSSGKSVEVPFDRFSKENFVYSYEIGGFNPRPLYVFEVDGIFYACPTNPGQSSIPGKYASVVRGIRGFIGGNTIRLNNLGYKEDEVEFFDGEFGVTTRHTMEIMADYIKRKMNK